MLILALLWLGRGRGQGPGVGCVDARLPVVGLDAHLGGGRERGGGDREVGNRDGREVGHREESAVGERGRERGEGA